MYKNLRPGTSIIPLTYLGQTIDFSGEYRGPSSDLDRANHNPESICLQASCLETLLSNGGNSPTSLTVLKDAE